jgi:hypothetical protein
MLETILLSLLLSMIKEIPKHVHVQCRYEAHDVPTQKQTTTTLMQYQMMDRVPSMDEAKKIAEIGNYK